MIASLLNSRCTACTLMGTVLLVSLAYWWANYYVDAYLLNDIVDGPLIVVSFVAGGYYLSWTLFNCRLVIDGPFMLRFGICLAWLGNGVWRVSRVMYAQGIIHGPIGAHDNWRGYMIVLMTIAGVLHILALDMKDGRMRQGRVWTAVAAVSLGIVGMLVLDRPLI